MPIPQLGGLTVTYPVPRVDRHEPLNALVVLIVVLAVAAFVAFVALVRS
jgi:hypothetical protein